MPPHGGSTGTFGAILSRRAPGDFGHFAGLMLALEAHQKPLDGRFTLAPVQLVVVTARTLNSFMIYCWTSLFPSQWSQTLIPDPDDRRGVE